MTKMHKQLVKQLKTDCGGDVTTTQYNKIVEYLDRNNPTKIDWDLPFTGYRTEWAKQDRRWRPAASVKTIIESMYLPGNYIYETTYRNAIKRFIS